MYVPRGNGSIDVKGKRVGACKARYISHSCVLSLKSEHEKNDIFCFVETYRNRLKALRVVDLDNSA